MISFDTKFYTQDRFTPAKYFSIDRVFRNESLDATHLAEFHQIEGVVADRDLSLGHLIGILHEFFRKLGMGVLFFFLYFITTIDSFALHVIIIFMFFRHA